MKPIYSDVLRQLLPMKQSIHSFLPKKTTLQAHSKVRSKYTRYHNRESSQKLESEDANPLMQTYFQAGTCSASTLSYISLVRSTPCPYGFFYQKSWPLFLVSFPPLFIWLNSSSKFANRFRPQKMNHLPNHTDVQNIHSGPFKRPIPLVFTQYSTRPFTGLGYCWSSTGLSAGNKSTPPTVRQLLLFTSTMNLSPVPKC